MRIIFVLLFSFVVSFASAQAGLKNHRVVSGETWYSIAKKYEITYSDLRLANSGSSDNLKIGQKVIIPAKPDLKHDAERTKKNATENTKDEKSTAKQHTVKSKETLTSISHKYNVTVAQLVDWNKLKTKSLKVGQKLIVSEAKAQEKSTDTVASPQVENKSLKIIDEPKQEIKTVKADTTSDLIPGIKKPVKADTGTTVEKKSTESFAKGRKEISEEGVVEWIQDQDINPGKYFALHREAPIGTIIKVINRMNRRVVYVKVVGKLPATGDNENIILKISKAAAEKLGVIDFRFQAELNYGVAVGN